MLPTVALVGRPNVGKSSLFNQLTRSRDALVADVPGLTRDRRYGEAVFDELKCRLVDTGGLVEGDRDITRLMAAQVEHAITEAALVLFVVDARAGLTAADHEIAARLRRADVPTLLVVNKIDGVNVDVALAEFSVLGFGDSVQVSAAHRRNLHSLAGRVSATLVSSSPASPQPALHESADPSVDEADIVADDDAAGSTELGADSVGSEGEDLPAANLADARVRVAVIGRPNVGKSTLINRWLGEDRLLVFDEPGTTRDSIEVPFEKGADKFMLIDTAGVRRRGRIDEVVEKFSVVKSLQAIRSADVAVLVIDASEGLVEQDLHLLSIAAEAGAGLVLAVNKWDALDQEGQRRVDTTLDRRLEFAPWISVHRISALKGRGVASLLKEVRRIYRVAHFDVGTALLTRILERAVTAHEPPAVRGRRIKLRFAHKSGAHPPTITIHGNQTESVPAAYKRYLENCFRTALKLSGTPVRIHFRTTDNPYAGRPNPLTERQQDRRKRVIRHRKTSERKKR